MLPKYGIVVNTARGAIVDQEALFAELKSGRLRAGLDVLDPDTLPPDHEARRWENLIWTCHSIGGGLWPTDGAPPAELAPHQEICLDNLRRFLRGEPLRFVMDEVRYARST
jgi:phosphoglycerate dehydrogenase-like enzyme